MRALILDVRGARASVAAVRALAADGWRVGLGAPRPDGLAAVSRHVSAFHAVPAPETGAEAFAAATRRAVEQGRYDVVFASSDADLLALSAARGSVPAVVPYPDDEALRRALDKLELGAAAERAGLAVPRTSAAEDGDGLRLPVIVKERVHGVPAEGAPSRPFAGELAEAPAAVRELVAEVRARGSDAFVQEVVRGRLGALTVLCDRDHRIVARVQQESLRIWPGDVGTSARARTVPIDEALSARAGRMLADLRWFGLAQLQFLRPGDGPPHVIDLNGRFYGSLALAVGAGVNLPALWARLATGREIPRRTDGSPGVRYQWLEADLRQARQDRRGGSVAADALDCLRWSIGAHHSIWCATDPRPALRAGAAVIRRRRR
jgi:predicted ATP-grasp superfamily ATP-dependent carboligase